MPDAWRWSRAQAGIGGALSERLSRAGASVAVHYSIHPDAAHRVVEAIASGTGRAMAFDAPTRRLEGAIALAGSSAAAVSFDVRGLPPGSGYNDFYREVHSTDPAGFTAPAEGAQHQHAVILGRATSRCSAAPSP